MSVPGDCLRRSEPLRQAFRATTEDDKLASATRAQRNAWLDEQLRALNAEDRAVIARAAALLSSIADS
jgi:hypothetical protein